MLEGLDGAALTSVYSQAFQGTDGRPQIYPLIVAPKVHIRQYRAQIFCDFPVRKHHRSSFRLRQDLCCVLEHRPRGLVPAPDHSSHPGFDDSGLLRSYILERISQYITMIQSDSGNDAEHRSDDIGAVQSPAEPCLDHCIVHPLAPEPFEGHSRGNLEERQPQPVHLISPLAAEPRHKFPRHHSPARTVTYPGPLPEIHQMR